MIAVDTNVLVYAHRADSTFHLEAEQAVRSLAESSQPWAIPWPCVHEFLAIVTHPRIYDPPTPIRRALEQVDAWLASPSLVLLCEGESYWAHIRELVLRGKVAGPRVHDARVAALCQYHGVAELWTVDRDFQRFSGLRVRNPVVGETGG